MKQLVCEICGSTDIVKQNGLFVCQSCGVKYASEDVKKLLVDVPETVAVTEPVAKSEHTPEPVPQSQSNASPTPPAVEVPTPAPAPAPKKKPSARAIVLSCIASVAFNLSALTGYYVFLAVILLLGIFQGMTNPLFHMYGDWETSWEATCANEGQQVRVCNVCGERETRAIPVLEHDVIILEAVESTCTTNGLTKGEYCASCGQVYIEQKIIPARHVESDWIMDIEPTIAERGKCHTECTICKTIIQEYFLDALDGGLKYTEKPDGTYAVTDILSTDSDLFIPEIYNGKAVTSVEIDHSTHIEDYMRQCKSITIPASVTSCNIFSFSHERLSSITVDDGNPTYHSDENCLIETATGTLLLGCNNSTIPDGVTSIGDYAFYYSRIASITIPDGVVSIGDYAFAYSSLMSITIPDSVTSIGYGAIKCRNLTSITIPFVGANKDGTGNTHFGYIFGVKSHHDHRDLSESLQSVIITGGDTIDTYAFCFCTHLTNITISKSITSINYMAFAHCLNLQTLCYDGTVSEWSAIELGDSWCANTKVTQIICSDGTVPLK